MLREESTSGAEREREVHGKLSFVFAWWPIMMTLEIELLLLLVAFKPCNNTAKTCTYLHAL